MNYGVTVIPLVRKPDSGFLSPRPGSRRTMAFAWAPDLLAGYTSRLRSLDEGIDSDSRYLATVRRAT